MVLPTGGSIFRCMIDQHEPYEKDVQWMRSGHEGLCIDWRKAMYWQEPVPNIPSNVGNGPYSVCYEEGRFSLIKEHQHNAFLPWRSTCFIGVGKYLFFQGLSALQTGEGCDFQKCWARNKKWSPRSCRCSHVRKSGLNWLPPRSHRTAVAELRVKSPPLNLHSGVVCTQLCSHNTVLVYTAERISDFTYIN